VAIALLALLPLSSCRQAAAPAAPADPAASPQRAPTGPIGALGHVQAGDGIIMLGARSLSGQPSLVGRVLVKEGDRVSAGQVVAELDSKAQLEATERQAAARIEVARRRLSQVQAGAKPSDIAAQQAEVSRLRVELANAQQEHKRYASLGANATASQLDALRTRTDATAQALAAAQQRLAGLSEVRPVDVALAEADLEEATSNAARARAEREASIIRAPIDGRVVTIHARAGEQVQSGLMEIAPLEPMYVVAEVAEADIARVKVGARATMTGAGLASPLEGTVERVAPKVLQNELMRVDPATYSDGRVVKVWIRVANGTAVANLMHMRVDVVIQP